MELQASISAHSRTGRIHLPSVLRAALRDVARRYDRSFVSIAVASIAGLVPFVLLKSGLDVRFAGAVGIGLGAIAAFVCITLFCARAQYLRSWKTLITELAVLGLGFGLLVGLPLLAVAVSLPDIATFAWRQLFVDDWLGWKYVAVGSALIGICPAAILGWSVRVLSEQNFRDSVLQVWAGPEDDGVYVPWTITTTTVAAGVALAWMPILCLLLPMLIGSFAGVLLDAVRDAET